MIVLTDATILQAIRLSAKGMKNGCSEDNALRKGLNVAICWVVYKGIDETFSLPCHDVSEVLK